LRVETDITVTGSLRYMSSFEGDGQYIFDHVNSDESSFIYGVRADGYNEFNFMGALEADAEIVIDLENEKGFYRPRMQDAELAEAVSGIQEYADEAGFDTYNFSFREKNDQNWRSIVTGLWNAIDTEDPAELLESEDAPKQIADGSGKPVEGHSRTQQAYTTPVGTDNSKDRHRFDASEGWDWS